MLNLETYKVAESLDKKMRTPKLCLRICAGLVMDGVEIHLAKLINQLTPITLEILEDIDNLSTSQLLLIYMIAPIFYLYMFTSQI